MRTILTTLVALAFVLSLATPIWALAQPIEKLKNGATEIIKSPIDFGINLKDTVMEHYTHPLRLLIGVVEAAGGMIKQVGYGAIDVVTFPVNLGK